MRCGSLWADHGFEVIEADFTQLPPPPDDARYNLVLTNPPYVRHHHLKAAEKKRLAALVAERLGVHVSGLAGLYCYFSLLSDAWLADRAVSAWLIPAEFMDVNYGEVVKRYLLDCASLLHIHRFCPSDVQFTDALVSSAIVIFEKRQPRIGHQVKFSFGGPLSNPEVIQDVAISRLRDVRKWTTLPTQFEPAQFDHVRKPDVTTLGELFDVKRGLATGNNEFFIIPRARAKQLKIPTRFLKPILPSPRYLRETILDGDRHGYPKLNNQLALIDCPLDEDDIRRRYPGFWAYLQEGKARRVHQGYLASRRTPWYSQESRAPAPFLCTYMGRSKDRPFRFIWNRSKATAANVYLMLYPRGTLQDKLQQEPELYEQTYGALCQLHPQDFFHQGRVYGGGLHKMEPAELRRLPASFMARSLGLKVQT